MHNNGRALSMSLSYVVAKNINLATKFCFTELDPFIQLQIQKHAMELNT